ncbi:YcaO-like family protein [Labrys sp. KNU-23]|uniref:YcaO-like family protein n=1 Tax=Labrys sp. KNU-23 TaxID=2789216 RepID=UPI00165CD4F2|nr:YcaO-like family protein [Labrys sp. KNU-23]
MNSVSPDFPPLAPFGISRVGDLTDLDIIGIPVWFAVRPNSRCLAVSQGKGLNHERARLTAIMEAIEGAVAEQTRPLIAEFGTPAELAKRKLLAVPLRSLVRCHFSEFDPRRPRAWVRGVSHESNRAVYAPYELVGLDMRDDFPWDYETFHVSSDGLGAGFDYASAALSALLELIERDGTTLSDGLGHLKGLSRPLIWQPGVHLGLDEAVTKVRNAGLEPHFFNKAGKIGVPIVSAMIVRPVCDKDGAGVRFSGGDACRFDAAEAALAALLEAVQSRLTNISGSRDDLDISQYENLDLALPSMPDRGETLGQLAARHTLPTNFSPSEALNFLVSQLAKAGYREVFFFDLPCPVEGVHVVRALVPGFRTFVENDVTALRLEDLIGAEFS